MCFCLCRSASVDKLMGSDEERRVSWDRVEIEEEETVVSE